MLNKYFMISSVAALLLVGCGSSVSSESTNDTASSSGTDITVERGPVYGALVLDANGEEATFLGNGQYRFTSTPTYPITADGGYIDINRNGEIDSDESTLEVSMQADSGSVITMATTLASNTRSRALLTEDLNLTDEEITSLTPSSNTLIAAISDAVYAYCVENNLTPSTLTAEDIARLKVEIAALITEYSDSNESVAFFEDRMFGKLGGHHKIKPQKIGHVHKDIDDSKHSGAINLDDIEISELTDDQKAKILYMAEEEKLARDIYKSMYETWNIRIFRNISHAESKHIRLITLLTNRYESVLPDTYEEDGVFSDSTLQTMYNDLLAKGKISEKDALEVGIAIEKSDIADLNESIEAGVPEDLELVYERLLNGSQRHLSAFEKVLDRYTVADDTTE